MAIHNTGTGESMGYLDQAQSKACHCIGPPGNCPCVHGWDLNHNEPPASFKPSHIPIWERCPACDGSGQDQHIVLSANTDNPCRVCNGKRIISSVTGKPPA